MDNSTFLKSDFRVLPSFHKRTQKLLPVSPWINKAPLQSQLYLNLCLSAWQLLNPYSAWSSCHGCIKALELGHFQVTGKYDVIIYIPSSAEWGSFLSLGESCLSATSLTEIILTTTGIIVYLEEKEWRVAKKTPQAKSGAVVHCAMQLCDCYPMDTSNVAPEEWLLQKEAHQSSMVRCRVPPVLWWVSLGRYPPVHPSPGITAAWGSLPFRAEQEQKLQSCSHSQDLFVCMHTALSLHHKLLQSASQKNRWLFNQIKDKVAFSK